MKTKEITRWIVTGIIFSVLALAFLFVQIEFGRVTSSDGDGKLYNGEPFYNYISYSCVDNADVNDIVLTISVNDTEGDCMYRFDRVILRNT